MFQGLKFEPFKLPDEAELIRQEVREFLARELDPGTLPNSDFNAGESAEFSRKLGAQGWIGMTWPKKYGGLDKSFLERYVVTEELLAAGAPVGCHWIADRQSGPLMLKFGTEEQKQRHLTVIAKGGAAWCQGYSEPGAGSDLASLRCRAEDKGDYFLINGQKVWTSGAQYADWMFCLVRTDFDAAKHSGISFVLVPMDQEGVTVKPISLISGNSPFCETFLDDAIAEKRDLVGTLNEGWTIGKRLLQHERSGQGGLSPTAARPKPVGVTIELEVDDVLKDYVNDPTISPALRDEVIGWKMRSAAFRLTQKRAGEQARDGKTPADTTSVFKLYGSTLAQDRQEIIVRLMGTQGLGWEGDSFSSDEIGAARSWLSSKAVTIYGGTNEVQANIIAKRVLGLPD